MSYASFFFTCVYDIAGTERDTPVYSLWPLGDQIFMGGKKEHVRSFIGFEGLLASRLWGKEAEERKVVDREQQNSLMHSFSPWIGF